MYDYLFKTSKKIAIPTAQHSSNVKARRNHPKEWNLRLLQLYTNSVVVYLIIAHDSPVSYCFCCLTLKHHTVGLLPLPVVLPHGPVRLRWSVGRKGLGSVKPAG